MFDRRGIIASSTCRTVTMELNFVVLMMDAATLPIFHLSRLIVDGHGMSLKIL